VANVSDTYGARAADDDGWSQARPVRTGSAGQPLPPELSPQRNAPDRGAPIRRPDPRQSRGPVTNDPRTTPRVVVGPPVPRTDQRSAPRTDQRPVARPDQRPQHAPASAFQQAREAISSEKEYEYGLPGWAALLVLIAIAGVGGLIDMLSGTQVRGGFNIGIVVASIAAILVVRRSNMFPVVVAPPIVYSAASGLLLYVRSNGLHDRKVLIDTAANWLVYGFPAIAAATAAVLIIAGIRLLTRR
jgi:hypothetical protein